MSKLAVVYWTMTGNTEAMAQAVAEGATDADVIAVADFSADKVADYDAFAFGCPAMGAEELDTDEFEPVWDECCPEFGDKPVALFGSYDWGTANGWRLGSPMPRRLVSRWLIPLLPTSSLIMM